MGKIHTAGPNKAIVICGRRGQRKREVVVGGWVYGPPFICNTQYLSLTLMTVTPHCQDVTTFEGVPLNVTGIAQCKIINSPDYLLIAAENFLGRNVSHIEISVLQTIGGHLSSVLGILTVEEIIKERKKLAFIFCQGASVDLAKMGLQIVSFVIKEISDSVGYLKSLGKKRSAELKRDAIISVAMAKRYEVFRKAECEKEASCVTYQALSNIQSYSKLYYLEKYSFDKLVNAAKANAQLAYELAEVKLRQKNYIEQINGVEIERKYSELLSTFKMPSVVANDQMQIIEEYEKTNIIEEMIDGEERIRSMGKTQANSMRDLCLIEVLLSMSEKGSCI